jgi:hypothetical protein
LISHGLNILENHRTAADEIRRAGKNLQGRHPAFERHLESWILRPDRVFRPHIGGYGTGRLVAIIEALHARTGINAQVRMDVDDARRHPFAVCIDDARVGGRGQIFANRLYFAVADQYIRAFEAFTGAGENGRTLNQHRRIDRHLISRGEGLRCQHRGYRKSSGKDQRYARCCDHCANHPE